MIQVIEFGNSNLVASSLASKITGVDLNVALPSCISDGADIHDSPRVSIITAGEFLSWLTKSISRISLLFIHNLTF